MQRNHNSPSKPSSLACVPCRRRHLKCDALLPACTRCQTSHSECRYVRSRRGLRASHARSPSAQLLDDSAMSLSLFPHDAFADWLNSTAASLPLEEGPPTLFPSLEAPSTTIEMPSLAEASLYPAPPPIPPTQPLVTPTTTNSIAYDPMILLYYQNFHPAHPILIPRNALPGPVGDLIPAALLAIMRYIGAHFYPDPAFKQVFRQAAYSARSDPVLRDNAFKVQAFLLLAIVDHAHGHEDDAQRLLHAAVALALDLRLHRACFAREHGHGHPVLEESWRRTYWELYVVDGLMAATREQSVFRLYQQRADVRLPCSEQMYRSGERVTPSQHTLADLQNSWTLGQDHDQDQDQDDNDNINNKQNGFSSFAYRVNAVQNLGMVLELNRSLEPTLDQQAETIEARLATALMALPALQGEGYDSSAHDEMVFEAQMVLYLSIIHLHHPRSNLRFASFHARQATTTTTTTTTTATTITSSCTRLKASSSSSRDREAVPCEPPGIRTGTGTGTGTRAGTTIDLDLHSHKLLRAADHLSNLATLPSPIRYRSPFFTCALAMCVVVHTAAGLVFARSASGSGTSTAPRSGSGSGLGFGLGPSPGPGAGKQKQKQESLRARIQLSIGALNALGKVWPLARAVRQQMVDMYQEVGMGMGTGMGMGMGV